MYKILVSAPAELNVCIGVYETYELAKEQFKKMVIHLITQNDAYAEGEWKNWKSQFPEEVQTVLTALEETGIAPAGDYDMDDDVGNHWFCLRDNDLDIDISDEELPGYKVSTNFFDTDEELDACGFSLWNNGESLIIMMLSDEE